MNNNMMERLNDTIRDREINFRGFKKIDTPVFDLFRIWYNFIKPHMGIQNKTPGEAALIEISGENKWKTLIQNASLNKTTV